MQISQKESEMTNNKILLDVMADKYCISILQAIKDEPKSASQLSSECGIFIGIVYRKLKLLQKGCLLDIHYEIRPDGKRFFLYKSQVKSIMASFVDNALDVVIEKR
ncbi:MAG: helix-turn-helix transcriptional regulator [Thaumarchaeota archaeon]|nr:helix-turn-helix transcriptional regulator [Nitrososphaerota archaeon]